jgi:hypothetical protein
MMIKKMLEERVQIIHTETAEGLGDWWVLNECGRSDRAIGHPRSCPKKNVEIQACKMAANGSNAANLDTFLFRQL